MVERKQEKNNSVKYPNVPLDRFDLVLSQTNEESKKLMQEVIKNELLDNKYCINYMIMFTDNPLKQRKVIKFAYYPSILFEELFMISMLSIDNDYIEDKLIECFNNNLINNTHDFIYYKNKYEQMYLKNEGGVKILML